MDSKKPDHLSKSLDALKEIESAYERIISDDNLKANVGKHLEALKKNLDKLDEINSSYPETKKFLEFYGVTRVSQLDEKGKKELREHLLNIHKDILEKQKNKAARKGGFSLLLDIRPILR